MAKYEFWKDWKRITRLEEKAIETLKIGKRVVLKNIPKKELISIYIKGSLPRRELTKKSDVDIVCILKTKKYLKKLHDLEEEYHRKCPMKLEIRGYSLWQLKTGKQIKYASQTPPPKFARHIHNFKLIYGKDLTKSKFFITEPMKELKGMIKIFKYRFLPFYRSGKFDFSTILKQVFWLTENEERAKGNDPPHSWKKLTKTIRNKNHIIHSAMKYRNKRTKDKKQIAAFIRKLEKHLDNLEKKYLS
ncbi:hypothetical protein KY335_05290 [Candidatus Woesearchaeota archaeon]|nr:hypothetical protein [Candidatus Woesearchaeota archaeon]